MQMVSSKILPIMRLALHYFPQAILWPITGYASSLQKRLLLNLKCYILLNIVIFVLLLIPPPKTAVILINTITMFLCKWMCRSVVGCIFSIAHVSGIWTLKIQLADSPKPWNLSNRFTSYVLVVWVATWSDKETTPFGRLLLLPCSKGNNVRQ